MEPLEGDQSLGGRVEGICDLPQVVFAVQVDALAGVEVGPDRDAGVAIVGVDEEVAVTDVIVDLLGLGGDLSDLGAGAPGHRIVGPRPFLIDRFPELGRDLDGDPLGDQFPGGVRSPAGLLVIDAGQDQSVLRHVPAGGRGDGVAVSQHSARPEGHGGLCQPDEEPRCCPR
ncbi:hypothetical protein ACWCV5_33755 [Streptomyces tubercidicus]